MTDASTAADGTVQEIDGKQVLRFERRIEHPCERVWAALTEPEELARWLAEAEIDLVEGGRVELRWLNTDDQGNRAVLDGTITELDPPRLLEYEGDIHGVLRWELRPGGEGCLLTFSSTLPPLEGEMLPKVLAGWHFHLDALEDALAGQSIDWSHWPKERWQVHYDHYSAGG